MRWCKGMNHGFVGVASRSSLPVARALLVLRRAAFPAIPWRARDLVAEELQRRIRAMEVAEDPRRPVVRLEPYTAPSDIGRMWK